ncbi:MAG: hypothetical protein WA902_07235, partial [Thermosynechococcaceae cyanobacterium]
LDEALLGWEENILKVPRASDSKEFTRLSSTPNSASPKEDKIPKLCKYAPRLSLQHGVQYLW